MQRFKLLKIFFFFILILPWVAWGDIQPKLFLQNIKAILPQEVHDEIYFLIVDTKGKPHDFYSIPGRQRYISSMQGPLPSAGDKPYYRSYWDKKKLKEVSNVLLWSRTLKNQESAQLIISLMEADFFPLDKDDTLGTIKLHLFNDNGILNIQIYPIHHAKVMEHGKIYEVIITHGKAKYIFNLNMAS